MSYVAQRHEGAQARWAIQIGTVDSLKWRGNDTLSRFLGRNSIEHSFTRLAKIWCDKEGKPLKNPDTGRLYAPIRVRGELNPGAIDPETGNWVGLRVDPHTVGNVLSFMPKRLVELFNRAVFGPDVDRYQRCKIGVLSDYGDDMQVFDTDCIVQEPVMIGDEETMAAMWLIYQRRAAEINAREYDYDLVRRNCHTINAVLNRSNSEAVREFAQRGFMRWGAKPDAIEVPDDAVPVISNMKDLHNENLWQVGDIYAALKAQVEKRRKFNLAPLQEEIVPA